MGEPFFFRGVFRIATLYLRFLFTYVYYNYYPCKNEAASLLVYITSPNLAMQWRGLAPPIFGLESTAKDYSYIFDLQHGFQWRLSGMVHASLAQSFDAASYVYPGVTTRGV